MQAVEEFVLLVLLDLLAFEEGVAALNGYAVRLDWHLSK